jgi:hypothetical protein
MAISISVDVGPLSNALGRMIGMIDRFKSVDIGQGLSDFQTQDMHRGRPFTMRSRAKGIAVTKVRPHSLIEMEHSIGRRVFWTQRKQKGVPKPGSFRLTSRKLKGAHAHRHWSTRPILREELKAVLQARMSKLLEDKISWSRATEE